MAKKKNKSGGHRPLTPKKYILTRARSLPLHKCLINKDWKESGLASIVVTRKHSNGNITGGFFLVDLLARGVKDTHYVFNEPEDDFFTQLDDDLFKVTSYALVHNIIYGAVEFADEHNFPARPDFQVTEYVLEEDTEDIEFIDLEFGKDGEPFIIDTILDDDDDSEE